MRHAWLLLLAPLVAGCFASNDAADTDLLDTPVALLPPGMNLADLPPFSLQLCDNGYRVVQFANATRATSDGRLCDFRVTKPLDDPTRFDWQGQHGPGNEVSLAVNPANPLNLAGGAKDYTVSYISDVADCGAYTVWNGHFVSHDGGRTWSNDLIPGFVGDPRPSALKGNLCNTDPVSVFDADGTYWHNGLNYRGAREDIGDPITPTGDGGLITGSQIFFARSQDGGDTFDRITFASYGQNDPGIFNDKNWLAVDPASDHMIHTWTNFYGAAALIMFVESFDAGATWTHPAPLTPNAGLLQSQPLLVTPTGQFSMPQYDASGDVWVLWSGSSTTHGEGPIMSHGLRANAASPTVFQATVPTVSYPPGGLNGGVDGCLEKTDFRASIYPVLAIDTSAWQFRDRKYIAYPAAGATGAGVWVTWSEDGMTWQEPIEVTANLPDDQFMPWIDVDPRGVVHVAYYDCSIDAGGTNMTMGYTYSLDGGDTWAPNQWIGQVPFDGDLGHHQSGTPFIGDYIAVDASCDGVHFFWADTRHGRSDVYAATLVRDQVAMNLYAPELGPAAAPCA